MTNQKPQEPIEAEVVSEKKSYPKDNWSINRVFWGMLFVVVGGLTLLANFDVVKVDWMNLWRLWPLMVISLGLSILSFRHWIWKLASILLIIVTMGAIVWVATMGEIYTQSVSTYRATAKITSATVKSAKVDVKAGAATLNISSADQAAIAEARLESNVASVSKTSSVVGGIQNIELSMNPIHGSRWWAGDVKSNFDIKVSQTLPMQLNVDAGASDTNIDVSKSIITIMNLKIGASSIDIKLGNKSAQTDLNIDSGVSSIKIRVPKTSGIKVVFEDGLTSKDMSDLQKIDKNNYQSADYTTANNKINIMAKIGVSSFTIERY